MDIRQELQRVRAEYEAMHELELVQVAKDMGQDVVGLTKAELIDHLMALEEKAAFH